MSAVDDPGQEDFSELLQGTSFHILFKADAGDAVKAASVSSKDFSTPATATLAEVRKHGRLPAKYHFCFPNDENIVAESTTMISYISSIKENVTAIQEAAKAKTTTTLVVYYRSTITTRTSKPLRAPPKLQKSRVASAMTDKDYKHVDPLPDAASMDRLDTYGMLAETSEVASKHPADMTGEEWEFVMLTNSLLHGLIFDPKTKTMEVAREPVFQLRRRIGPIPHSSTEEELGEPKHESIFAAPAFRVTDDSSVTITVLKNSLQKSMVKNSFTSDEIEAGISGGVGSFSGEVSGSYEESSAKFSETVNETGKESIHASYDFPRVKVILDSQDLELSEGCKEFCKIRPFDVDRFYARFGIVFSCTNLLGARLQSFSDATLFSSGTKDGNEEKTKIAFSASFSSPWVGASASASHERSNKTDAQTKTKDASTNLHWEAKGGETSLSTNPTAWIHTVVPYHNWRIIRRQDVRNILDLVDRISPNILYSPTNFQVFDLPITKTWLFANSGFFMESNFTSSPIVLATKYDPQARQLRKEAQWIVEYVYDKGWITIANFGLRLIKSPNKKTLWYMTPAEIAEDSSVHLSEQPYRWRIERDGHSSSIFIFIPGGTEGADDLYLTGVKRVGQTKPSIQLRPLDKAKPEYDQQWVIQSGMIEMAATGGWEATK